MKKFSSNTSMLVKESDLNAELTDHTLFLSIQNKNDESNKLRLVFNQSEYELLWENMVDKNRDIIISSRCIGLYLLVHQLLTNHYPKIKKMSRLHQIIITWILTQMLDNQGETNDLFTDLKSFLRQVYGVDITADTFVNFQVELIKINLISIRKPFQQHNNCDIAFIKHKFSLSDSDERKYSFLALTQPTINALFLTCMSLKSLIIEQSNLNWSSIHAALNLLSVVTVQFRGNTYNLLSRASSFQLMIFYRLNCRIESDFLFRLY